MSHPKVVQATRFFRTTSDQNHDTSSAQPAEAYRLNPPFATLPPVPHFRSKEPHETALHPPHAGDIGYAHSIGGRVDHALVRPHTTHHLHHGLGLQAAHHAVRACEDNCCIAVQWRWKPQEQGRARCLRLR